MRPEEWQRCVEIFSAALERQPEERAAFVDHACAENESLRREVTMLLRSHEQSGDFISEPAFVAEPELLGDDRNALIGTHIGPYRLESVLGSGGMSVVYLARDERLGRKVGLKLLPPSLIADMTHLSRLKREARTASALNHPNIVTIHDIGSDHTTHYIASELIEGETLRERLMRGPIQLSEAIDIATQVASALVAAHDAGVVHRDIKPENIMLRPDGYVKVLDFGIAQVAEREMPAMTPTDDAVSVVETNLGSIFGTARYMSPEQARGAPVDKRTDIWSLGVVFYEMATGNAPFAGDTPREVMSAILEKEPLPLAHHIAHAPAELQQIISKTLRKDREERYRSAHALLEALKRLRHNLEVEAELQHATAAFSWRRWARSPAALTFLLLIAALAVSLPFYRYRNLTTSSPPEKSIAVLPLLDLSETKDQEYFCDGISEEILHALAKVDGLRVVARTSSFSFKGKSVNAREVGEKLNVANVLEGTLRREGNRVRVTAELINTRSGFHLWTETYDRELAGVFALEDEITRSIVAALKVKLAVALPDHEQRNTEAYEPYLQGLFFSNKSSEEDLRRALGFFQRAVEKDPTFSRAWSGIAKVWYFLADVYVRPLEAYPASKEAALKAVALDEKDAEAHCYLSESKRVLDWDLAGADAELTRALQLDPNSAPAHLFSALHPLFRGNIKEGLQLILEAEKLDPVSPITSYVATAAYLANDRVDDAVVEGQRTLQLDPNYFYLDSVLAAAYREKGNFPEAIALYIQSQEGTHLPRRALAITYTRMGREVEAKNILAQLLQARERRYVSAPLIAAVAVALGDKEEAFRELERAYAEHSGVLQWIAFLPEFRALHSDARFPDLLQRISAPQDTVLKITETTLSQIADPNAQTNLTLKVGVKPRPGTENGHVVRIKVDFYDLTKDNRLKLTNARTSYNWLTAAEDWTDPSPKFLAATYLRPKTQSPSADAQKYGGFIVRVYFDGQLQDSRASQPELLTLFPAPDQLGASPSAAP